MSQTDRQDIYLKIYLKRQRQSKPKEKKLSFFFFFFRKTNYSTPGWLIALRLKQK